LTKAFSRLAAGPGFRAARLKARTMRKTTKAM
jgi:hypothetical protein